MFWRLLARWRVPLWCACVAAASFLANLAGTRAPAQSGRAESVVAGLAAPLQGAVAAVADAAGGLGQILFGGARLRRENEALRVEIARLRREVQQTRERLAEGDRLGRLLEFREETGWRMTAARVVGRDASGLFRTILLDRGAEDGLRPQLAVVTPDGVVGRVIKVFPHTALVLLMADRSSGIDAIVQRTRDQGVVQGTGGERCELKYLSRQAEVEVGDYVVTSGMGGVFPKGVWLGQVSRVDRGSDLFQSVEVVPTASLDRLEEVFVVAGSQEAAR